jgi:hypothetical protein
MVQMGMEVHPCPSDPWIPFIDPDGIDPDERLLINIALHLL